MQHYVVFYGFIDDQLIVGDPRDGVSHWEKHQLDEIWKSKRLLRLTPNQSFGAVDIEESKIYQYLFNWIKDDLAVLISSVFIGIIIAIFSLSIAIFSQKLLDVIIPSGESFKLVVGLILFSLILFFKSGLGYARSSFLISQSKDFNNRMINSFFRFLMHLPKSFFDSKKVGEMIARMNDTRRIQLAVTNVFGNILIEVLVVLASIVGVFMYSWIVGLLVILFLPIYLIVLMKLSRPISESQKNVMNKYAANEANYIDVIGGVTEIKNTGTTDLLHKNITQYYQLFRESIFDLGKIQIKFNFRTELVGILLIVFVISIASAMVLMSTMSLGYMIAILSLSTSIGPSLTRIALFNVQLQEAKVAYTRVEEFANLDKEQLEGEKVEEIVSLEARDIFFNFPGSLPLLEGIDFKVKKGSMTTILGESGTGKSTILQLIQRHYNPNSGQLLINEKPISDYSLDSFRAQIGIVPQDIKIFNNYLLFNIILSDNQQELEQVVRWSGDNVGSFHLKKGGMTNGNKFCEQSVSSPHGNSKSHDFIVC